MYGQLPAILSVLPMYKGGLRGESGEAKVSGKSDAPPCPLNVGVVDLELTIVMILDHVGSLRIADLANHHDGLWWAARIRRSYELADRYIGIKPHWSKRFGECGECGQRRLGNWSGDDSIHCENCLTVITRDEYVRQCLSEGKQ